MSNYQGSNRFLVKAVKAACDKHNILYTSFSEDWVLRLEQKSRMSWVISDSFDVNGAAAAEIASDKVATSLVLTEQNIPAVQHVLARFNLHTSIYAKQLASSFQVSQPVVAKPLSGNGGREVRLFSELDDAITYIQSSSEPAWAISPYLDLVSEYRFVILDNQVLLAYEKTQPATRDGLKYFNLKFGAIPRVMTLVGDVVKMAEMAKRAMNAIGLTLGAVDICVNTKGEVRVIEINKSISLQRFAERSSEYEQLALGVYDEIVSYMFK